MGTIWAIPADQLTKVETLWIWKNWIFDDFQRNDMVNRCWLNVDLWHPICSFDYVINFSSHELYSNIFKLSCKFYKYSSFSRNENLKIQFLKSDIFGWSTLWSTMFDFLKTTYMHVLPKNFAVVTFVLLSLYLTFCSSGPLYCIRRYIENTHLGNKCWPNVEQNVTVETSMKIHTFFIRTIFSYLPPFRT